MDLHQLETFVAVAREGSITRASERLHLSQPAVSAHVRAMEDALGLALFERTSRGMSLTRDGERLLVKAEETLSAHRALMDEATRLKGRLTGTLRLGAGSNSNDDAVGRLLVLLSERSPDVEVVLEHGSSRDILTGIRNGRLDAGVYNEAGEPDPAMSTTEVSRFGIWVVAAPGIVDVSAPLDWHALEAMSWIYPTASACCGRAAETLFETHRIRPERILSVDRENVTKTLIARGTGVGLLHTDTAEAARARGELELLAPAQKVVRVLFAHLSSRAHDPLLAEVTSLVHQ